LVVLIGLTVMTFTCLVIALLPGPSEDKKWAMAVLASIVSAGVGYLGGRASKPDSTRSMIDDSRVDSEFTPESL
jgi:hypothetical protein